MAYGEGSNLYHTHALSTPQNCVLSTNFPAQLWGGQNQQNNRMALHDVFHDTIARSCNMAFVTAPRNLPRCGLLLSWMRLVARISCNCELEAPVCAKKKDLAGQCPESVYSPKSSPAAVVQMARNFTSILQQPFTSMSLCLVNFQF